MLRSYLPSDDPEVHLRLTEVSSSRQALLNELRAKIENSVTLSRNDWAFLDDRQLLRFLTARKFDVGASLEMVQGALEWREKRKTEGLATPEGIEFLSKEGEYFRSIPPLCPFPFIMISFVSILLFWFLFFLAETGKCYIPGLDRWGRPVLVLNGSVQNTPHCDDHMMLLAWSLELMIMMMPKGIERYTVFMNLEAFSFYNMPSMAEMDWNTSPNGPPF